VRRRTAGARGCYAGGGDDRGRLRILERHVEAAAGGEHGVTAGPGRGWRSRTRRRAPGSSVVGQSAGEAPRPTGRREEVEPRGEQAEEACERPEGAGAATRAARRPSSRLAVPSALRREPHVRSWRTPRAGGEARSGEARSRALGPRRTRTPGRALSASAFTDLACGLGGSPAGISLSTPARGSGESREINRSSSRGISRRCVRQGTGGIIGPSVPTAELLDERLASSAERRAVSACAVLPADRVSGSNRSRRVCEPISSIRASRR
jgi:hypothetical protein